MRARAAVGPRTRPRCAVPWPNYDHTPPVRRSTTLRPATGAPAPRPPCQDRYCAHLEDGSTDPSPAAAADLGLSAGGGRSRAGGAAALDPRGAAAPAAEPVGGTDAAGGHAPGAAAVEPVPPGHDPGADGHRRAGRRGGRPRCTADAPGTERRVH